MPSITISLSEEEAKLLKERGKNNFLSMKEQVEEIIRRSLISYKARKSGKYKPIKTDDKLIAVFSRDPRGRKKKRSKK